MWNGDGSLILTASEDGTARVWDAATGEERARLTHDGWVNQATWNGDESLILTASWDGTARVWDAAMGEERFRLAHDDRVTQATWNGDERLILTVSGNTVYQYYTRMEDLLRAACQRALRNMTREEWGRFMKHEPSYRATCPNLPIEEEE
jgi:WD40 repeat protein